jgi:poly(3-hydroxybutyrate) depolymerase
VFYQLYELNYAAVQPLRAYADAVKLLYSNPLNPISHTPFGRSVAATAELFERTTRRYGKPAFGLTKTVVDWKPVAVKERVVWSRPFCNLIRFERDLPAGRRADPKLLIVAPMSGHYATLLRGTVEAMLPYADVYITDWADARMVPVDEGKFDLDDYIDYVVDMFHELGPDAHVMAVCQPSVPVLAAVALMEAKGDRFAPATMTLMGGPVDTRRNPTAVNLLAKEKGLDWFRDNVIMQVPWPVPGFSRDVYPGFLQLSGFMSMNLDRHITAHKDFFMHLVKNDGDGAEKHRDFYDEYLAVMDLTAEFYLQTVDTVFIRHALPKGEMTHRGTPVDPKAIRNTALLTIEGENDDISGLGQTQAAQDLCVNIPAEKRVHYMQPAVGHYGVFNGSRFRSDIVPRIVDFISSYGRAGRPVAKATSKSASKPRETRKAKS